MNRGHMPKGKNGAWKTGQRVPMEGFWEDQHGQVNYFTYPGTFPPCIGRKGENADRKYIAKRLREQPDE